MKRTLIISMLLSLLCCQLTPAQTYTLQQCKELAVKNNIAVRNAEGAILSAQEQKKEAYTNYFPSVSATGAAFAANKGLAELSVNPSELIPQEAAVALAQSLPQELLGMMGNPITVSMMKNGILGSVTAMQPVFAGGQIVNGNKLAGLGVEVSQLKRQLSVNEVELATEQYYWQIVQLKEKMRTLDVVEANLNSIAKDVQLAVKAGLILNNDLLQVQLKQNEVASNRIRLASGIKLCKQLLAQHMGVAYSEAFDIAEVAVMEGEVSDAQLAALRTDHETAVLGTTEYRLLGKGVEAGELQVKMEKGKVLPTVAVGAGFIYNDLMDKSIARGLVMATVSVPISGWWGNSHAVKRKKIALRQAQDEMENNRELLIINMQAKWDDVDAASKQLAIARQSIDQASENLRIQTNCYHAGTINMTDLLQAQTLLQQARDQYTEAYTDYQIKALQYRQATGQ